MKRKIGELRNIPIVEGDKNLVREGTEIHINDLQSKGCSTNSNFEYWYIKYVPNNVAEQTGIRISVYFRRGVARYDAFQGAVKLMKCTVWPPLTEHVYGMHAMEVLPSSVPFELDGITLTLDTTSYDSFILSMMKSIVGNIPDDIPEEQLQAFINQMKEQYVEITKEEFEEIYNSAENKTI